MMRTRLGPRSSPRATLTSARVGWAPSATRAATFSRQPTSLVSVSLLIRLTAILGSRERVLVDHVVEARGGPAEGQAEQLAGAGLHALPIVMPQPRQVHRGRGHGEPQRGEQAVDVLLHEGIPARARHRVLLDV